MKIKLIYKLAPGEGPEPKVLVRHRMQVTPDLPWECENLEFARQLVAEYPQIEPADERSRRALYLKPRKGVKADV